MRKYLLLILSVVLTLSLVSCSKTPVEEYKIWVTEADDSGSSIRWEFTDTTLKYCNVYNGEDTFTQTFNYTYEGSKLTLKSDYATLTFEISSDENGFIYAESEKGNVLKFQGKS